MSTSFKVLSSATNDGGKDIIPVHHIINSSRCVNEDISSGRSKIGLRLKLIIRRFVSLPISGGTMRILLRRKSSTSKFSSLAMSGGMLSMKLRPRSRLRKLRISNTLGGIFFNLLNRNCRTYTESGLRTSLSDLYTRPCCAQDNVARQQKRT